METSEKIYFMNVAERTVQRKILEYEARTVENRNQFCDGNGMFSDVWLEYVGIFKDSKKSTEGEQSVQQITPDTRHMLSTDIWRFPKNAPTSTSAKMLLANNYTVQCRNDVPVQFKWTQLAQWLQLICLLAGW